jgi:hypothetical protein
VSKVTWIVVILPFSMWLQLAVGAGDALWWRDLLRRTQQHNSAGRCGSGGGERGGGEAGGLIEQAGEERGEGESC